MSVKLVDRAKYRMQQLDDAFLDGMREAAKMLQERPYQRLQILEEVARRAKSGNVRQKTGLAERSDAEASATPQKQGDAS